MKSENIGCLIYIIVVAIAITLTVLFVRMVLRADIPDWLKFVILLK